MSGESIWWTPCSLVTFVLLCVVLLARDVVQGSDDVCNHKEVKTHLDELCEAYSSGHVSGSLCEPLCTKKEILLKKCIGHHGVKLEVLKMDWNGEEMIMKTFRPLGWKNGLASDHFKGTSRTSEVSKSLFMKEANETIFNSILGGTHAENTQRFLEKLFSECDLHGDGVLGPQEQAMCWALIQTEEYVLYSVLDECNGAVPAVRGVCGNVFAVGYASPLSKKIMVASWSLRAKVALSLLEMLVSLENTPYGTLHMCDVHESNYGVWFDSEDRPFAQAIDLDSTWFGPRVSAVKFDTIRDQPCNNDSGCDFIRCHVRCNESTGTCSDEVASNNLQTLCEHIFAPTLLQSPPFHIRWQLNKLLDMCSTPSPKTLSHISMHLLKELRAILVKSLRHHSRPNFGF